MYEYNHLSRNNVHVDKKYLLIYAVTSYMYGKYSCYGVDKSGTILLGSSQLIQGYINRNPHLTIVVNKFVLLGEQG